MSINQLKKNVAKSVLDYLSFKYIIGIGSGSTILYFIKFLARCKKKILGVVSSSYDTTMILQKYGIQVFDINTITQPVIYIDSADEINTNLQMIKGGGGALTTEKIIASIAKKFICIVDESKVVDQLGVYPLPIEVIFHAYSYVLREIMKLGGFPKYRNGVVTDHGNIIIDVYHLNLRHPKVMEDRINSIPGVVTVGLFCNRKADMALIGTKNGIKIIK
ncbi:ribose-5-phosphate isomerase RpiA [Buchnera aphidicola]|uniref:ribose-5-phosphate isomerase RpiA n=1 Tax=Buchnera aphidicola TaxID=9 RepID=UPI003464391E